MTQGTIPPKEKRSGRTLRLGIFASHPIQYFVPIYPAIARTPGIELLVHYFSDHGVRGAFDPGFGRDVQWDIPLLDGYDHVFLSRDANITVPKSVRIDNPLSVIEQGRFDAVLISGYYFGFETQIAKACRELKCPLIMRGDFTDAPQIGGRGWLKTRLRDIYLRRFYKRVTAFCTVGKFAERHLLRLGVPKQKLFFSPYSVDTELFERQRAAVDRAEARRKLGIGGNQIVVLFSGKMIPTKAPLLLIEALRRLERKHPFCLIMLGEGQLLEQVKSAANCCPELKSIFPGFVNQSHLGKYYAAADLFVLPSVKDTWGLVVNEAMQFALPVVVSTGCGCCEDLLIEGRTGFSFELDNVEALADHIDRLASDTAMMRQMGLNAAHHIRAFSTQASADGIVQALEFCARNYVSADSRI